MVKKSGMGQVFLGVLLFSFPVIISPKFFFSIYPPNTDKEAKIRYLVFTELWTRPEFESRKARNILLFPNTSGPSMGPIQLHIQWALELKQPQHEADHSPPYSVRLK